MKAGIRILAGEAAMVAKQQRATLDDLCRVEGKAELIGGRIVHYMATGHKPGRAALRIAMSLEGQCSKAGKGVAHGDHVGYAVPELSSGRESFSPDASYYDGPLPADLMRFIEGPPTFAVEIRSENDYTPAAEVEMAAKRDDYFEAGTLAVWDVDPIGETITLYTASSPSQPTTFRRGDTAHAGPAVPGWSVAVDGVFG
jgi:Uma2 family endonuclease